MGVNIPIRIGARGSKLSMVQATFVAKILEELIDSHDAHIKDRGVASQLYDIKPHSQNQLSYVIPIKTTGDKLYQIPLAEIGGKGLFLKEIEEQLLAKNIDIAVHSMKDVPALLPKGLIIGAVLPRYDPYDVLICAKSPGDILLNQHFESASPPIPLLPYGATVGTCSNRRKVFLEKLRPDLRVVMMRGNVDTRIAKIDNHQIDGIVLAMSGLIRLGLTHRVDYKFSLSEMIPAVGQGSLCIECREDDDKIIDLLQKLDCMRTRICIEAERTFMQEVGGDCSVPLAAYARFIDQREKEERDYLEDKLEKRREIHFKKEELKLIALDAMFYNKGELLLTKVTQDFQENKGQDFSIALGKAAASAIGIHK